MRHVVVGILIGAVTILAACSQFEVDRPPLPENVWYPNEREVVAKGEGESPQTGHFYYIVYWWHDEIVQFRIPAEEGEACYQAATVRKPLPLECPQPDR